MNIRRRYQFKRGGFIFIAVTLLVSLGAFNSQNNLLFWAFGVGLSLLIVSGFVSGSMLMGVRVVREPVTPAPAGGHLTIRYTIQNTSKWMPAIALTIRERPTNSTNNSSSNPDRIVGPILAFIPHVPRAQSLHTRAIAIARSRGPLHLNNIEVVSSFPFGIFGKIVTFSQPATALIHPPTINLQRDLIRQVKGQSTRTNSAASSKRTGHGGHFHALRPFTTGDPLKSIAWRASARRDELVVTQTEAPQPNRILIIPRLDAWPALAQQTEPSSTSPEPTQPIEQILTVAASLAKSLHEADTEVGLSIPTHNIHIKPATGSRQQRLILDTLAALEPKQPAPNKPHSPTPTQSTIGLAIVEIIPNPATHPSTSPPTPNAIIIRADTIAAHAANQPNQRTKPQPTTRATRTSPRPSNQPASPLSSATTQAATTANRPRRRNPRQTGGQP